MGKGLQHNPNAGSINPMVVNEMMSKPLLLKKHAVLVEQLRMMTDLSQRHLVACVQLAVELWRLDPTNRVFTTGVFVDASLDIIKRKCDALYRNTDVKRSLRFRMLRRLLVSTVPVRKSHEVVEVRPDSPKDEASSAA